MSDGDAAAKLDALGRLAQSRAEIRRVLEPPPRASHTSSGEFQAQGDDNAALDDEFPRSRTMRLLMSGRGIGTVGAMAGGLLLARPALALKLVRMVPTGAVARMLMVKAIAAYRARR